MIRSLTRKNAMKPLLILAPTLVALYLAGQTPSPRKAAPHPGSPSATRRTALPSLPKVNGGRFEPAPCLGPLSLGGEAQARGDDAEAERQYREVVDMVPNAPLGYERLARLNDEQGRERDAYGAWQRALAKYEPAASSMRDDPDYPLLGSATSASVNDSFRMYVMYLPPGSGSMYVPLGYFDWSWSAGESRASTGVPWPYTSDPVGSASGPSWTKTATHPQWSVVVSRPTFSSSVQP